MLNAVFDRFVDQSPVTVMVGGLLERIMTPEKLDAWFEQTAEEQYTRTLLFSTVFDLMSQVVCGIRPSLHAAYQANVAEVGVKWTPLSRPILGKNKTSFKLPQGGLLLAFGRPTIGVVFGGYNSRNRCPAPGSSRVRSRTI